MTMKTIRAFIRWFDVFRSWWCSDWQQAFADTTGLAIDVLGHPLAVLTSCWVIEISFPLLISRISLGGH